MQDTVFMALIAFFVGWVVGFLTGKHGEKE